MSKPNQSQLWKSNLLNSHNSGLNYNEKTTKDQLSVSMHATNSTNISINTVSPDLLTNLDRICNLHKMNASNDKNCELNSAMTSIENETERCRTIQQFVETAIGDNAKQQILHILEKISTLTPPERLLLYLRMPGGAPETDPLRQPQNPLGTRSEINHTINWVRSHLEHDPNVSIPKQDVYDDYVSYCTRVEIKPLSTADFGKVMKQVFPGIRPRRLGTRGHSRYCYAAMRKATKLDPPALPDLKPIKEELISDDDSWCTIKTWAESMLNTSFDSFKDLSEYIKNNLNLTSSSLNSSRQLIQKKMYQRELKERKKMDANSQKPKRRKKKLRNLSHSSDVQPSSSQSENFDTFNKIKNIKIEINDDDTSNLIPINLTNDCNQKTKTDKSLEINLQGTNLDCDNNNIVDTDNKIALSTTNKSTTITTTKNSTSTTQPTATSKLNIIDNLADKVEQQLSNTLSTLKSEPGIDNNIYCKKVRQAQQSKGLWSGNNIINVAQTSTNVTSVSSNIDNSSDAILSKRWAVNENSINFPFRKKSKSILNNGPGSNSETYLSGVSNAPMNLNINDEKQDLANEFIIPRERVISICNMDKHALDDYLNGGDNSQEQEAELLQYFQNNENNNKNNNDFDVDLGQVQTSIPLLESYALNADGGRKDLNSKIDPTRNPDDKISQLRSFLTQNLQNTNTNKLEPPKVLSNLVQAGGNQYLGGSTGRGEGVANNSNSSIGNQSIYQGSASASLAMLSQRHIKNIPGEIYNTLRHATGKGPKRKLNLNIPTSNHNNNNPNINNLNLPLQSPTARRRNIDFVPISPGPHSPHVSTLNAPSSYHNTQQSHGTPHNMAKQNILNPFISPTGTQVAKTKSTNRNINTSKLPLLNMSVAAENMFETMLKSNQTSFSKPHSNNNNNNSNSNIKAEISASAPPSPVIQMRYNNPLNYNFTSIAGGQQSQCSSDMYPIESRSQSVPLRNSPGFNTSFDFHPNYSTCNSITQTPVPPEFTDFNNSNILDIFANSGATSGPSQTQPNLQASIKLEDPFMPNMIDSRDATTVGNIDIIADFRSSNYNQSVSRSVPSTPLPHHNHYNSSNNNNNNNVNSNQIKTFDISKSVPTTPNSISVQPFRYSPGNRDFLINGNTLERGKLLYYQNNNNNNNQGNDIDKNLSMADDDIDDLTNFGVSDPIMESDLLNNL